MDRHVTRRLWRAYRIAPAVAPLSFCALLFATGVVWCGALGMMCNAAGFAFLPFFAVLVGLPAAYIVALLLMPLAIRLRRRDRLTRRVVIGIGAGVAVIVSASFAWMVGANSTPVPPDRLAAWLALSAISIAEFGLPILFAAIVFALIAVPTAQPGLFGPRPVTRRLWTWGVLGACAALGVFATWVAIYEPGQPGAPIYFRTRPGVPFIWESAPGEPKDLMDRLEAEGFPTAKYEIRGGGRGDPGSGWVSLVRWRDRPATRDRLLSWLRAQPEVESAWIDSATVSSSDRIQP
jgi:hypothetical protein